MSNSGEEAKSIQNVHGQISELLSAQFTVETVYLCGEPFKNSTYFFLRQPFFGLRRPTRHPILFRKIRRRLSNLLSKKAYDAVIVDGIFAANLLLSIKRLPKLKRILMVVHGEVDLTKRRLPDLLKAIKIGFNSNWRIVAVSKSIANSLRLSHPLFSDKIVAIDNCLDFEALDASLLPREDARRELGLSASAIVIGTHGRMAKEKNYDTLIAAFSKIDNPNCVLLIMGDGAEKSKLIELAIQLKCLGRVRMPGFRPDAPSLLNAIDIYALPSKSEGSPLSLAEAMGARLPVVWSRIQALESIISSAEHSFALGNQEELAKCLQRILSYSEDKRIEVGVRNREIAERQFSRNQFAKKYIEALVD